MEKIVQIPDEVKVEFDGLKFSVSGKKGSLERDFYSPLFRNTIKAERAGNSIKILADSEKRKIKSMVGTVVAHINNMIIGVSKGWSCKLKIVFVHFPVTVKAEKDMITITNFLGSKALRKSRIMEGAKVEIKGDEIIVTGLDKEAVGQTAARIEIATKIKARDRRVFQDGIFITERGVLNE